MKKAQLLPLSAAILFSMQGRTENNPDTQDVYQQQSTVVTASRYQQEQDDIIPSITVIDRADILQLQANTILDLLVLQQGIDVARNGGNGTATSVFMRGTNSNHALVLIDGMRVASSFTGSFAWDHLPVSQIERIEIVRGTRVSYYGSDAIGGVINIITRKQDKLYARYTQGSFGTQQADVGFGASGEKGHFSLILGSQVADGFSATNENNSFAFNEDDDSYENLSLNFNTLYKLTNGSISLTYLETKSHIEFDSFFTNFLDNFENEENSDIQEQVGKITWKSTLFNGWNSEIGMGFNRNELETVVFSNKFNSKRYQLDWLLNKQVENQHYGLGLSYRTEDSTFNNPLVTRLNYSDSRENVAAFANWRGVFNKNIFSVSGRYDHNNIYGNDATGDLSWAYQMSDKIRINVSAGTAFKAPNLNELFSPQFQGLVYSPELETFVNFFAFEGNPDLQPEESINYETGIKAKLTDNQNLSFNAFYYKIDNLVDFQGSTFKPVNVNESTIKGLEATYDYGKNGFNVSLNATVQDANNDESNTPLLRRPDNKINLNIDKVFNKFSIGSSVRYASKNPDFGIDLQSYTVIDVRASYALTDHWRVAIKVENADNEEYQVINGFNTPERSGYFTIEWQQ